MFQLLNKIKQNSQLVKRGNQLFDLVNESATQQAQRQGIPVAGTTSPQAAADMGVTQDQAKMAGSSAQLQNVERLALRPTTSQRQVEEMKQTRTEKTADEKRKEAQAAQLGQFGGRIQGVVQQAMKRIAPTQAAGATPPPSLDADKFSSLGLDQTKAEAIKPSIEAALNGTATQEQLADIANTLPGLSTSSTPAQITEKLESLRQTPVNSIISNTQKLVPNQLTVGQLSDTEIQSLGFQSRQDLAKSLGLNPDEIDTQSMDQLQAAASSLQQQDYATVKQLQAAINDPSLSPAARAEAQAVLRQMGTAGVQATEEDFAKLNADIQNADVIELDGKPMQIAELLSDEGVSAAVKAYLTDPKYAEQLRTISPGLADFIDKNKQALSAASNQLSKEVDQLAKTQADNVKLSKTDTGIPISDDLNKLVYGDKWNKFGGTALAPSNAHKILNDPNNTKEYKEAYVNFLNSIAKSNPDLAKQFADYSYEQLKASKLDSPNNVNAYANYLSRANSMNKVADPVQAISVMFPTLNDTNGLNDMIKSASALSKAGMMSPTGTRILELFGNAPLDLNDRSPANIQRMQDLQTKLKQFFAIDAKGNPLTPVKDGQVVDLSAIPNLDSLVKQLQTDYNKAKADPVLEAAMDGVVDSDELQKLAGARSASDLTSLYNKLSAGGLINESGQTLKDLINKQAENEFLKAISSIGILQTLKTSKDTPTLPKDLVGLQQLKNQILDAKNQVSPEVKDKFNQLLTTVSNKIALLQPKSSRWDERPKTQAGRTGRIQ
jgi:hypothetical protein